MLRQPTMVIKPFLSLQRTVAMAPSSPAAEQLGDARHLLERPDELRLVTVARQGRVAERARVRFPLGL
jgi:hypothetical protein